MDELFLSIIIQDYCSYLQKERNYSNVDVMDLLFQFSELFLTSKEDSILDAVQLGLKLAKNKKFYKLKNKKCTFPIVYIPVNYDGKTYYFFYTDSEGEILTKIKKAVDG